MKKATEWDASKHLTTEEDMAAYLNAALEDGDTSVIAAALGDITRERHDLAFRYHPRWSLQGPFPRGKSFL